MKKKFTGILLAGCIALSACASNAENTSEAAASLETAATVATTVAEIEESSPNTKDLSSFPFTESELFKQLMEIETLSVDSSAYASMEILTHGKKAWKICDMPEKNGYRIACMKLGFFGSYDKRTYIYCFIDPNSDNLEAVQFVAMCSPDSFGEDVFYDAVTVFLNLLGIEEPAKDKLRDADLSQENIQILVKNELDFDGISDRISLTAFFEGSKFQSDFPTLYPDGLEPELAGTQNSSLITKAEFDDLKTGMTYEDAAEIIGGYGELTSESGTPGSSSHTAMYKWKGEGDFSASATAVFQNGTLTSKSQYGLE